MTTFGMILFIIMFAISLASVIFGFLKARKLTKSETPKIINWKQEMKVLIAIGIANAVSWVLWTVGAILWAGSVLKAWEWILTIFGGLLFAFSFYTLVITFVIHYYGKELKKEFDTWLYRIMIISIPLVLIFLFVWTDGFADYLAYPLPLGISFTSGFVYPGQRGNLAWYAIFILSGALAVYFLCDHKFYQQYGQHGLIESTFLVAFPAGIIGARIAYVIGNWEKDGFGNKEWWRIFAIWEGGLTILGGAIAGIVVGVLWFMWRRRGYSIWIAVDIIVPTILIAQGIGRWGNFFNCEVHGNAVDPFSWYWLPKIIFNNMHYSDTGPNLIDKIYVPLFLIEGMINFFGYFVLSYVFGKKLRKYTELGDLAFGYIIWYGLTRTFMEPTRYSSYVMGTDGYWSWMWSLIFIGVGSFLIVMNHFIRYLIKVKKQQLHAKKKWFSNGLIGGAIFFTLGLALIIVGSIMMKNNTFVTQIEFNNFNIGIILLVIGISLFLSIFIYLPYTIEGFKVRKVENSNA